LDAFTVSLLSNDEVIAINQDPLGKAARLVLEKDGFQVWKRELANGDYAVGIFNIDGYGKTPQSYFRWGNETATNFQLNFNEIGLNGNFNIRDVWRQKNLGKFNESINTSIRHHGVMMYRFSKN
jgi:alpha-galactosidase